MLSFGKLKIVNFKILSDIDDRKPSSESGAAYVIHFLFLAAFLFFFGPPTFSFLLPKSSRPVNLLHVVIWDDRAAANFKHCS